jgi:hypothetical protein
MPAQTASMEAYDPSRCCSIMRRPKPPSWRSPSNWPNTASA